MCIKSLHNLQLGDPCMQTEPVPMSYSALAAVVPRAFACFDRKQLQIRSRVQSEIVASIYMVLHCLYILFNQSALSQVL